MITREQRSLAFLKNVVERIYAAILRTEYLTCETYPQLKPFLPEKITFIHSEELLKMYPDKTPKEREDAICKKYGAVFVIGIGGKLSDGQQWPKTALLVSTATYSSGIPFSAARLSSRQWVSVLTRSRWFVN